MQEQAAAAGLLLQALLLLLPLTALSRQLVRVQRRLRALGQPGQELPVVPLQALRVLRMLLVQRCRRAPPMPAQRAVQTRCLQRLPPALHQQKLLLPELLQVKRQH